MLKTGDIVDYHSIIGGEVTTGGHKIVNIGCDNSGTVIAFIEGHSGYVAIEALSNDAHPMTLRSKRLTRSQKRYSDWLNAECGVEFGECFGECEKCRAETD